MNLKYKIKEQCAIQEVTYEELAAYLGVAKSTVFEWSRLKETDYKSIPGDHLVAMCFFFEISVEDMHHKKHFATLKPVGSTI
jgi:DNA-binding Xre family transcriptional regulator